MNKEFWNGKKVMITGGNGFVGSNIVQQLVEFNASTICIVRDDVAGSALQKYRLENKITEVNGDLIDFDFVNRVISEYEPEYILHLAAQPIVTIANKNPMPTLKTNIDGTIHILEASRINGGKHKIVVASTDKAYGVHENLPYTEDYPLQGKYPYDASKSCVDLLAQMYYHTYKMPICITRCSNIYGPNDLNFNRIVPESLKSIIEGKNPQIRSDGKFTRDYMYTKDMVNGYLTIAENMHRPEVVGQAFNLSTNKAINVLELVDIMIKVSGKDNITPVILNQAKAEIQDQYLDNNKAKRLLDWEPKYSLQEGLKETYKWYEGYLSKRN